MAFFTKNKTDDSKILLLLKDLAAEVSIYSGKVGKIDQDLKSLRGLVNKKLGNETEELKSDDSFTSMRAMNRQFPPL